MGYPMRTTVTVLCAECGASLQRTRPQLEHARYSYCSLACKHRGQSRVLRGPDGPLSGRQRPASHCANISAAKKGRTLPPDSKTPPLQITCEHCQRTVTYSGYAKCQRKHNRFCSHECAWAYLRVDPQRHPSFRGGRLPYYGPNWPKQSRLARARDRHTCQACGLHQTKPLLHVHHLRPFREFGGDYEAAHQLDNLRTLCRACHKQADVRYEREQRAVHNGKLSLVTKD